MSSFRTKPPITYLPPTREEVREAAEAVDLKKWSPDFATDLANIAAGGEVLPSHQWRHLVGPTAGKRDKDGDYVLPGKAGGVYTKDAEVAKAAHTQFPTDKNRAESIKSHENICNFLRNVDFTGIPGNTPLQKAVSLLKIMSESDGWSGGAEGDPLPIFIDTDGAEQAASVNKLIDDIDSIDTDERELLDDENEASGSEHGGLSQTVKFAADMVEDKKHIWLQVSRDLENLARMNVSRSVKVIPNVCGDDVRSRPIASFAEMHKLKPSEWALPASLRNYRVATRTAQVRERVTREEKKMLLYMIVDCSGSMKNGQRIAKAGGVLFNRLKAVVRGEAEVYFRFFDDELFNEYHADTPETAKALMRQFQQKNFSGGGTSIAKCAIEALKRIDEIVADGRLVRPELVIVTDGEDNIDALDREQFGLTRLHAFVVEESKTALVELARSTGGVGIDKV